MKLNQIYNKIYDNLRNYIKINRYNKDQTNIHIHNILLHEKHIFNIINNHIFIGNEYANKYINIRIIGPYTKHNIKIYKKRCLNYYFEQYDIINYNNMKR